MMSPWSQGKIPTGDLALKKQYKRYMVTNDTKMD